MKSLGKELTEAQSNAMLKRLDTDGDGLVSRDEFLVWSANNQPTPAPAASGDGHTFMSSAEKPVPVHALPWQREGAHR